MIYRPCGVNNLNTSYIITSALGYLLIYLKYFLKLFYFITVIYKNSYPQYWRRDDLWSWPICILGYNNITINFNNRYIILYNLYFSIKYRAHINVEVCTSIKAVKYINKYIYKGNNRTTIQLLDNNNKINKYFYGRYIGPIKAIQQLFEFPIYKKYPPIIQLAIYLSG